MKKVERKGQREIESMPNKSNRCLWSSRSLAISECSWKINTFWKKKANTLSQVRPKHFEDFMYIFCCLCSCCLLIVYCHWKLVTGPACLFVLNADNKKLCHKLIEIGYFVEPSKNVKWPSLHLKFLPTTWKLFINCFIYYYAIALLQWHFLEYTEF